MNPVPERFLDTNILIRYLTGDDSRKAEAAFALLQRVEQGEEKVVISPLVIFETVFTLQKGYQTAPSKVRDALTDILSLRGVELPQKSLYLQALDLYVRKNISYADAYNAAYMDAHHLSEIYSWDADFDTIDGLTRIEPALDDESASR